MNIVRITWGKGKLSPFIRRLYIEQYKMEISGRKYLKHVVKLVRSESARIMLEVHIDKILMEIIQVSIMFVFLPLNLVLTIGKYCMRIKIPLYPYCIYSFFILCVIKTISIPYFECRANKVALNLLKEEKLIYLSKVKRNMWFALDSQVFFQSFLCCTALVLSYLYHMMKGII